MWVASLLIGSYHIIFGGETMRFWNVRERNKLTKSMPDTFLFIHLVERSHVYCTLECSPPTLNNVMQTVQARDRTAKSQGLVRLLPGKW
jgi:hypothetical protein